MNSHLILLGTLALMFSSCAYHNEEELYVCDTLNVTYSQVVAPIIQQRCFACHSDATQSTSGSNLSLEGYVNLKGAVDAGLVLGNIRHEPGFLPMPRDDRKLKNCEISKIEIWVNKGMPND